MKVHYCINNIMKINEIISEEAPTGDTMAGNLAIVPAALSSKMIKRTKPTKSDNSFKGFKQYKLDKSEK
jgi:hypothetical protein